MSINIHSKYSYTHIYTYIHTYTQLTFARLHITHRWTYTLITHKKQKHTNKQA